MSAQHVLIEVTQREIGGESVQSADARQLHSFLAIAKDFNQWMREQIARARLVSNRDYLPYETVVQLPSGAKHRKECALTIEAAKHIAMMSGSEKGFEVREYFIECERRLKHNAPPVDLNDPTFLRTMLLGYTEKVIELQAKVAEQEPKVNALQRIAESEGSFCISDAAKMLKMPPRKLFSRLTEIRWIFRRPGCSAWLGYQDKVQAGLLVHKSTLIQRDDGTDKIAEQVRITGRGMARLAERFECHVEAVEAKAAA